MSKEIAPGKYHLPGGHVEFGETLDEAIVREFSEEFRIAVKASDIFQTFAYVIGDIHTVGICFLLSFDGDTTAVAADGVENDEVRWIVKSELADYFDTNDHNYMTLEQYFADGAQNKLSLRHEN